ncbi:MAG: thiamine pyrophosphate-dependent enzyme, partial [Thermodesulfobacteriota bacterium]|nr:thiamine pyrophosphate-dependent enzyme [Thermodesulfobacteriota bacterium]
AAKTPHYLNTNLFNGLHGRSLPVATGIKLTNPDLTVIVESGDGCSYGEGGNHFLAAIRRNIGITLLVHNNQIYGLTKGQASPTTGKDLTTKAQPRGVLSTPFNPISVAVTMRAGFVARAFSGMVDHLSDLISQAIVHQGFSLIDILQPCVSFNKVNTFAWYKRRCKPLSSDYDPTDWEEALKVACQWGDNIPVGIIYKNENVPFEKHFHFLDKGVLVRQKTDPILIRKMMESYS